MTSSEFAERIIAMTGTLYRVSYTFLREKCDREDAVQECIAKAWRRRESLRDESRFRAWVIRILINECYDILRRAKRETSMEAVPEQAAPPDADFTLRDAILALPNALRAPIVLHYMEGYGTLEIAQILRVPQGTVKSRMRKARALIKNALREEPANEE